MKYLNAMVHPTVCAFCFITKSDYGVANSATDTPVWKPIWKLETMKERIEAHNGSQVPRKLAEALQSWHDTRKGLFVQLDTSQDLPIPSSQDFYAPRNDR